MAYTVQQWLNNVISAPYGPINDTRLTYMESGIAAAHVTADAAVAKDSAVVAGSRVLRNKLLEADAQPTWRFLGSGQWEIGPGGATAPDVFMRRESAGLFRILGSLLVDGNVHSSGGRLMGNGSVPAGAIACTIAAAAPTGWLLLDGSTVVNGQTLY